MERLTQSNFNYCKEYCAQADRCAYANGVIPNMCGDAAQYYRLAAYEDTGLTPDEAKYFGRLIRGERMVTEEDLVKSGVSQEEIQRMKDVITAEAEGRLLVLDTQEEDAYPGLKRKYIVLKADTGNTVENCFVLRPHKDPAAKIALEAYAKATDNKALADDITSWIGDSGKVLMLPCKIGDTVYQTDGVNVYESKVTRLIFDTENYFAFDERAIGKTVFLTREEAEITLKNKT